MDTTKAAELLRADRQRTEQLLAELTARGQEDRDGANEPGDMFDAAEPLVDEQLDDSVVTELRRHLDAIGRAEGRVADGTYGRSIRSGAAIPDDRLEADPTAELTIEEARAG